MAISNNADRGTVVHLSATGEGDWPGAFLLGDQHDVSLNSGDIPWNDTTRPVLSLWIKNNAPEKPLRMVVLCTTVGGESDPVQLVLMSDRTAGLASGGCYAYGIGEACNSGVWERVQVDVAAAIAACSNNGDQLTAIHGVMVLCADASVDEVELSAGLMCRTYQVSPGAELSGVLAVQTGLEGGEGLTIPGAKVYYQYNDLGTVHATTDDVGARVGLWIPDFYGNYAWACAGSPARPELGLTGKLWDQDAGLYYFNARWLDPQRGRWMSEEPFGIDGPNLYHFVYNDPISFFDINGLAHIANRPLGNGSNYLWLGSFSKGSGFLRRHHIALSHAQIFFDDGKDNKDNPSNIGFWNDGDGGNLYSDECPNYRHEDIYYDDELMREAYQKVPLEKFRWLRNNCQCWLDEVIAEYNRLMDERIFQAYQDFYMGDISKEELDDIIMKYIPRSDPQKIKNKGGSSYPDWTLGE